MLFILDKLDRFGISSIKHSDSTLIDHLVGTYEMTKNWDCPEYLCLAALCHSIYGTESFSKNPATLKNRQYMQETIGEKAERLAYLFGAHVKESLWQNLVIKPPFFIRDRFENRDIEISKDDLCDLITITLANWLEQRPRTADKYQNLRKEEFLRSRPFLSKKAYLSFIDAYGL
jgi:hypothetical protein